MILGEVKLVLTWKGLYSSYLERLILVVTWTD